MARTVHAILLVEQASVWIKTDGKLKGTTDLLRKEILARVSDVRFVETNTHLRVILGFASYEETQSLVEEAIEQVLST